jgi:hypothetical protein
MKHPLDFIPKSSQKSAFFGLLIFTLLLLSIFQVLNAEIITSAAPAGIVSHQLAWTPGKAREILASWNERASLFAAFSLGFDYLFMVSYSITVALGSLLVAGRHPGWMSRLSPLIAKGVFAAAIFDALENIFQARQLLYSVISLPVTVITGILACIKFSLLIFGILFSLLGLFWFPKRK